MSSLSTGHLCYKKRMKKLLLGCLLLTACQNATSTPTPSSFSSPTQTLSFTPSPAIHTPEPTVTQTFEPSPTSFPRYFTNEFDTSLAGWVTLQANNDSNINIKTENSTLLLQLDVPFTWLYALYGVEDYQNVRIDTQFQNRASTPSSVGLICRYSETGGWYEFNVSTDGAYNVLYGKWLTVGIVEYLPIADGSSNLIQPSGATQQIGLLCSDDTLSLFINGTLLRRLDVARYELTDGTAGLTVSSYENTPIVAAFDWVKINEP